MIIEGLLTTEDLTGTPHLAPMGPVVDDGLTTWLLRPFQSSTTFKLLRRNPICVFHVVDDVLMLVQAALGQPSEVACEQHESGGWIIPTACHWYQLRVTDWNVNDARSEAWAVVEDSGVLRPFWGWNRAKHAVLEATILVTRLHLLGHEAVANEFDRLENAVEKTAGTRELQAWHILRTRLNQR